MNSLEAREVHWRLTRPTEDVDISRPPKLSNNGDVWRIRGHSSTEIETQYRAGRLHREYRAIIVNRVQVERFLSRIDDSLRARPTEGETTMRRFERKQNKFVATGTRKHALSFLHRGNDNNMIRQLEICSSWKIATW